MRTLITILLITVTMAVQSQTLDSIWITHPMFEEYNEAQLQLILPGLPLNERPNMSLGYMSLPVTIRMLQEYNDECYNDSTHIEVHVGSGCVGTSYGYGNFQCETYGHYDKMTYRHRRPTFIGFIKWLEKFEL